MCVTKKKQVDVDSAPAGEVEPGGPGALAGQDRELHRPGQQQLQHQGRRRLRPSRRRVHRLKAARDGGRERGLPRFRGR